MSFQPSSKCEHSNRVLLSKASVSPQNSHYLVLPVNFLSLKELSFAPVWEQVPGWAGWR